MLKNEVEKLKSKIFSKAEEKVERVLRKRKSYKWTLSLVDLPAGKTRQVLTSALTAVCSDAFG